MKHFILLATLLVSLGVYASNSPDYYTFDGISYKEYNSYTNSWSDWTDWNEATGIIVIADNYIKVSYNGETRTYYIISTEKQTKTELFLNCRDNKNRNCNIMAYTFENSIRVTIGYANIRYCFNIDF